MRIWDLTNSNENCILDMNSLKSIKVDDSSPSPKDKKPQRPTSFDCSREYFSAIGCQDGTLHVDNAISRLSRLRD